MTGRSVEGCTCMVCLQLAGLLTYLASRICWIVTLKLSGLCRDLLDAYQRVASSLGRVGGMSASTRSSNFGMPSTFEIKSTPMAAHKDSARRSVVIENKMIGVFGKSFFRTVAASAPFNRGMARSRMIKSGLDFLDFSIASTL